MGEQRRGWVGAIGRVFDADVCAGCMRGGKQKARATNDFVSFSELAGMRRRKRVGRKPIRMSFGTHGRRSGGSRVA